MFLLVKYIVIVITMYVTGVTMYVSELTEYVMRAKNNRVFCINNQF